MLSGMVIGGVAGGLGVLLVGLLSPQKKCPRCGEPLPKFRAPQSGRQAMWGGWTCGKCGQEIDRRGRAIGAPPGQPPSERPGSSLPGA
jgi:hypothetical protein